MRNLKRALSLTLASVMLLGMMVIGTSAASYPDVDKDNNVEAIEVLQAVGVMQGDDKGNFDPDRTVSRNEMAIVMAKLLNLDYNYYKENCPFWDVPDYAKPYVGACYANGIVSGYNATQYGGSDTVTAVQAASMMMRALGYFKYQSDYKDGFVIATVRQASKLGLFKDINASNDTPLTRDQVAQLALNTLETAMVDAKDNTLNINTGAAGGNISITGGQVDYVVRTSTEKFAKAINDTDQGGNETDGRQGCTVELGEQLYNGDLVKNEDQSDDFGHPAVTWKLKNTEIGTYEDNTDLVETWTGKVTKDAMYKAMGKNTVDAITKGGNNGSLTYWVDGVSADKTADIDQFADRNNTGKINNDAADTGNGSVTKLYVDKDDNATIVVVSTYVYQASSDYNSSTDELRIASAGDTSEFPVNLDTYTLKGEDFNLEDVKEDDYLLVTAYKSGSTYKVATVKPAEVVTGEVTGYKLEDNITVDGTDYSYSLKTKKDGGVKSEIQATGSQVALVLDEYGYVIAVDTTLVGGNYVFITEANNEGMLTSSNVIAKAYFADGTEDTITLKKVGGSTNKNTMKAAKGWYTYSKDSADKYTLTAISGSYDDAKAFNTTAVVNGTSVLVQGNAKLADITGASGIRTNSKTQFIIVDKDGDVYTYTGTSNAPDIVMTSGDYDAGYVWNTKNNYATYVFISMDGNTNSEVDSSTEDDVFYILLDKDATKGTGDDTYYIYNAIVDGKKTSIETDDQYPEYTMYTKVKRDSKTDRITSMKEVIGTGDSNENSGNDNNFTTDDDWKKFDIGAATRVTAKNEGMTIGDRSFITGKDSQLNLVIMKGAGATTDKDADYEAYCGTTASTIASVLNGYDITNGYYYIVTKDAYDDGDGNTELKHLFLYVEGDSNASANDLNDAKTDVAAIDELPAPAAGPDYTAAQIETEVKKLIEAAAGPNVKVEITDKGTIRAANNGTDGSVTNVKVKLTSKTDSSLKPVTVTIASITVKAYVPSTPIKGGIEDALKTNFSAPEIKGADGKDIKEAKVGDEIQVVLKSITKSRAAGEAATKFEAGQWYTVTINGKDSDATKCETAGELRVTYTVRDADVGEKEILVKVSAVKKADEPQKPVDPTFDTTKFSVPEAKVTVAVGASADVTVTNTDNYATYEVASAAEATATVTKGTGKITITGVAAGTTSVTVTAKAVSNETLTKTFTIPVEVTAGSNPPAAKHTVSATVAGYTVAGAGEYAEGASVTITLTQATGADLAENAKFTVTATGATGLEGTVTKAGVAHVDAVDPVYQPAGTVNSAETFATEAAKSVDGKLYKKTTADGTDTYTAVDSYDANVTEYFALKTAAVGEVAEVKGEITITFTMPASDVSITAIAPKTEA
jgi:hypothetical protein